MESAAKQMGEAVRFDAWRTVFEKTNRIISGKPIRVSIEEADSHLPPSWTDGETVTFHAGHVREMLRTSSPLDAVLRLKGLNYHELSHVLYSPRTSDELSRKILREQELNSDPVLWQAFNALEDQRIETWFTATFGPSRRYFEAIVLQWLIREGNTEAAILLHGRKYLPAKLRVDAGVIFEKKYNADLYRRFREVIDAYLKITLPSDTNKAYLLVKQYRALVKEMADTAGGMMPQPPIADNGCHQPGGPSRDMPGMVKAGRAGAKEAKEARDKAQSEVEKAGDADADYAADKAAAEEEAEEAETQGQAEASAEAEADGEGEGEGAASGRNDGQDGEADDEPNGSDIGTESDSDEVGSGGSGAGGGAAEHEVLSAEDALAEAMRDLIETAHDGLHEIAADEDVQEDIEKVLEAVKATTANGEIDARGGLARTSTIPPSQDDLVVLRKVVQTLTKIRQEAEPQTLRRQVTGRVDARRALTRRPNEVDVFTQYDEGDEEATGVEAVILLDMSGSMRGSPMLEASKATWVLKRAFDKVGIRTTVLAYDNVTEVMWQGREKAQSDIPVLSARGGTDPTDALRQAAMILGKSHAANKVLVTVTDGWWGSSEEEVLGLMKVMHKADVTSLLVGIGKAVSSYGKHGHQVAHDLASIRDLPKAVLRLVADVMKGSLERAV